MKRKYKMNKQAADQRKYISVNKLATSKIYKNDVKRLNKYKKILGIKHHADFIRFLFNFYENSIYYANDKKIESMSIKEAKEHKEKIKRRLET